MKFYKDYSNDNLLSSSFNFPNLIGQLISFFIAFILYSIFDLFIFFPLCSSFIGLSIGDLFLRKFCTNVDKCKCQQCKNWNCKGIK